ncbi:MAG: hypothetical protein JNK05_27695 [Myxococcales bacterium]|nr:hypothetical protein [Myxococcales bacterium]
MTRDRTDVLLERLEWLDKNIASLDRDQKRAPYLVVTILLAPVAWFFFGGLAALLVAITAIGLASVAWYVVWGHFNEYTTERLSVRRELSTRGVKFDDHDRPIRAV